MMKKVLLLAALWSMAAATARAETLVEATAAALETSPALAAERARLEAVREEMPIAWAEALPQITLDAAAFDGRSTEQAIPIRVRENPEYWIGTVRSSTLLFGGGHAWFARREARAQIASGIARYQDRAQTLVVDVARAYGDVLQEQAVRAAQEEAVENFTEQRRYVDAHVRNGFLTRTDMAQADARLAAARADLATASARLVAAHEAFTRLVGRPPSDLRAPASLVGLPPTLEQALVIAEDDNPVLIGELADYEASDAAVDLAAATGRARVTFDTNYSEFAERHGPAANARESENQIALRMTVPLFNGGEIRARTRQQRHLRDAARSDVDEVRRRVRENVTGAWANLTAARARLESNRARVESAELASRGVRREQEFGQRSTIDVLNQETELLQARIALAQAEREAMVAERELAQHLGVVIVATQSAETAPGPGAAAPGGSRLARP